LLGEDLPSVCGGASLHYSIPAIGLGEMTAVFTLHSMMGVCIQYPMPRISKILGVDSERLDGVTIEDTKFTNYQVHYAKGGCVESTIYDFEDRALSIGIDLGT
jgi:hypothetical protein